VTKRETRLGSGMTSAYPYRAVVIGGSAGGLEVLLTVIGQLPVAYPLPVLVIHHLHKTDNRGFADHLARNTVLPVSEAQDKTPIAPGHIYTAPANYHLLVERDSTLALSVDAKVNWARPSIDVLFESAARCYGRALVGVILSGANEDGAEGMKLIREYGGLCLAQDPATASSPIMPRASIARAGIQGVLPPDGLAERIAKLGSEDIEGEATNRKSGS